MVDCGLTVDRQKIDTNIVHNFFYSLARMDLNNHLIFTVVDEKKMNSFTLTAMLKKKSCGIPIT